ncbi:MAG: hypothetical protein L0L20_10215 [Lactococcus lactis]|uniref:PIL6_11 n=2 Tax=Lactococcus lactis TaxID=1358 RepID=G0WJV1_LACLL|nr:MULTISPECIES: hypothetical protein [Lactococcus]EGO5032750.1 hypothetical protein [Enterococcus faecalis]MDN6422967.1 hypothetical protein [Tetragenococcus koreensis]ADX30861.1 PIL6_11 [Lactococcus lactis subsp. lactis]ADZ64989.1 hypothetical protein CVCAS_pA0020 [Lactococcus lactis subsp. lactis CV56]MCT0026869.1 hypothetical protein [Lactococcus lactis subsp. lactis]
MNKFLSILHLIFIRPIEILIGISGLIIRFFLLSPLFLVQNLVTGAIIIWIYGQVVALVTAHQFLPASYFDISKYPSYVQEVLQTKMSFAGMWNWYIMPLAIVLLIEVVISFLVWFIPKELRSGGE